MVYWRPASRGRLYLVCRRTDAFPARRPFHPSSFSLRSPPPSATLHDHHHHHHPPSTPSSAGDPFYTLYRHLSRTPSLPRTLPRSILRPPLLKLPFTTPYLDLLLPRDPTISRVAWSLGAKRSDWKKAVFSKLVRLDDYAEERGRGNLFPNYFLANREIRRVTRWTTKSMPVWALWNLYDAPDVRKRGEAKRTKTKTTTTSRETGCKLGSDGREKGEKTEKEKERQVSIRERPNEIMYTASKMMATMHAMGSPGAQGLFIEGGCG